MNEQRTISWWSVGLKYGLITGLVGSVLAMINFITGNFDNIWLMFVIGLAIYILAIVLAHREYKANNAGYMTYGEGLMIGTLTVFIAGVIGGLFSYVYIEFVDPGILNKMVEVQIRMMENFGLPEDKLDEAIQKVERDTTAANQLKSGLINGIFSGLVLSLIVSAFTKKRMPEFE
ncbi:DUF4199 domain-containing protein [Adhaeribacter soli]|uniref:DUF4199 domain-containing protein n=1 Tax=Adhaeribacter soli TaxID=2607655 RepID=A0A5N1J5Q0_9BACT|nr:DUF4199 domain-containing protein [Adhaeribacter soli]KAA9345513.1 DUF4199 domain-containing protein [Adhaeribacter soli]